MKNVLITGGAGFLGSHVVDRAMNEGYDCYIIDNLYTGKEENIEHHFGHPRYHFFRHDIINPFPIEVESTKFDLIFHLACPASPVHYQSDPIGTTLTCVNGTVNVLKTALRCDCPVLITSTSEVYGDPLVNPQNESYLGNVNCTGIRSCYDEGKRCAESLCFDFHRKYNCKVRVARIFNTYGPRMCFNDGRIISNFLYQSLTDRDITIYGTGQNSRSFQYYEDLIEGFWKLIHHPTEIGPVNLGNPEEYTVLDMAKKIQQLIPNTKSKIIFLEATKDDPRQRRPDISKAKNVLGWEPRIPIETGLNKTKIEFESRIMKKKTHLLKIYVQCNPLLDISSHVDLEFLKKYNFQPSSACLVDESQMGVYAELEKKEDVAFIPGGSGLNTARVAQWLSHAPKRSIVNYVGCIADDKTGNLLKILAEREGVIMNLDFTDKVETGKCGVLIVGKDRSLVASLGAANLLSASHFEKPHVIKALEESKLFYLTGFTLTVNVEYVIKVAKQAHANKGKFMMNLSAPFIIQFFTSQLDAVLPYIDVLFSNDDEARVLSETKNFKTDDIKEIAKKASALPYIGPHRNRLVVFTQGSKPTIYCSASIEGEVPVKPIEFSKIVDTNGAGDAFVGGFLSAASHGCDVPKCCEAGNYAAGVIIQHDGCTFPEIADYSF